MRIAVIDDEKYSRVALVRQIEGFLPHAEIFEAGSGAQAVELLEKHTFDILFLDIHLGDMEGTTIAALARHLMPQTKIIFATAYSDYAVRAFELRADDYLLKPFDPDRIREALKRCTAEPAPAVSAAAASSTPSPARAIPIRPRSANTRAGSASRTFTASTRPALSTCAILSASFRGRATALPCACAARTLCCPSAASACASCAAG